MSALNLNKVILCGRLTADVELKATQSGGSFIRFTLAVNRPKGKDGTEQKADFFSCVAWDKHAEFISMFFHKGDSLFICGTLRPQKYNDGLGRLVLTSDIHVTEAHFVDKKSSPETPDETPPTDERLPF